MNLYTASTQWMTRPADERFWTLEDGQHAARFLRERSRESPAFSVHDLTAADVDGNLILRRNGGGEACFTHYAFGQLCTRIGAPAAYLRTLPRELVVQNLNHGLHNTSNGRDLVAYVGTDLPSYDGNVLRAITSDAYTRIYNDEVFQELLFRLRDMGWRVPPARPAGVYGEVTRIATEDDVLNLSRSGYGGLSINVGDTIAPAGIYVSDRDMFVFMVSDQLIEVGGDLVSMGCFVRNSEVGNAALTVTAFTYDHVCGNHIVWGAGDVRDIRIRHVGQQARNEYRDACVNVRRVVDGSVVSLKNAIVEAKGRLIADDRDKVVQAVFEKGILSRKAAEDAYDVAEQYADVHGDPRSPWGLASGVTRNSQQLVYADERHELDKAAAKVLRAF